MLLLHISDIHFRAPQCSLPTLDPERPYRTTLVNDVRERVKTLGPVAAILVGGDIAFRGAAEEYAAAYGWLQELAEVAQCSIERIFVIPGNHDVDRSVVKDQPSVRNVQQAILRADDQARERELFTQFSNAETGRALFASHAGYNEFAKRFNCQLFSSERLYWRQDLDLGQSVTLRIHGLTSTLLSGAPNGNDDVKGKLYVSPLQTVFDPLPDVINLALCHHPPDWLMDQDAVDDAVGGRAAIQMFGHKHRQRITREAGWIRFSAGAVNPDRNELGWRPGYNLVNIHVSMEGAKKFIDIEAHLLAWETNPDGFNPILTPDKKPIFTHRLSVQSAQMQQATAGTASATPPAGGADQVASPANSIPLAIEVVMSEPSTRNLILRFWNLASSQRRDIALSLGLIGEEDLKFPEAERYGRALLRAGERGLLPKLAEEIEKLERR